MATREQILKDVLSLPVGERAEIVDAVWMNLIVRLTNSGPKRPKRGSTPMSATS